MTMPDFQNLRKSLAQELLAHVKKASLGLFEKLIAELLVEIGYGGSRRDVEEAIRPTSDGGIDGIVKEDPSDLDAVYIEAKRGDTPVGSPEIKKFAGTLQGHRATRGVFITTYRFSKDALDFVSQVDTRIVLIDGDRLAELMIDHDVGVAEVASYVIKRVDPDYFTED